MNYLVLQPGESIYIPADGIHAYLAGDIIECMARSNNVLNSGFCPRADRDNVDLFCSCLTFSPHSKEESILPAQDYKGSKQGKTQLYSPPLSEFDMLATRLTAGEQETLSSVGGPSILIATEGGASLKVGGKDYKLTEGGVFFVAPGKEIQLVADKDGLLMHTAFVE